MSADENDGPVRPEPPGGLVCVRCGKAAGRLLAEPDVAYCSDCEAEISGRILAEEPPSEP